MEKDGRKNKEARLIELAMEYRGKTLQFLNALLAQKGTNHEMFP